VVVDDAQDDIRLLRGFGQLEPLPPLHPLPNHRDRFLKPRLQLGIARIARLNEDPKRLWGTPGRFVLRGDGLIAQRRQEKREHQDPGSGRTAPDHRGVAPRSRFVCALARLTGP